MIIMKKCWLSAARSRNIKEEKKGPENNMNIRRKDLKLT